MLFKKPLPYNELKYRNIKYIQRANKKNQNITDGRNNIKMNIIIWEFISSAWRL